MFRIFFLFLKQVNVLPPIEAGDFLQNQVKIWEIRSFCIELGRR